ncbi:putative late transcription factor VLTF-2 [Alphaentomopoxvirus acuprea]|uniref:Putative late transcription factor VLTF-2 n=1 Tax=Alphaentomopoxvirus acuprea TaxID=62099 RepID=W6JIR8_9POXV|nr:putative late transcription factor VLTF-2 [Anomala cuprea entomopoxvirus]BAO49453.1 putative late transcription factor VLTF-2 [Anomala cuprea entomopoxvirus]
MDYKTDFTEKEKIDAAYKLIKNYKSKFYECKYENNISILSDSNECLYCKTHHTKHISIITNISSMGYFCSELCKMIFYSIVQFIFNLPVIYMVVFIPYYLLDNFSKKKFQNIKTEIEKYNYKKIIISSKFYNKYLITNIKLLSCDYEINLKYNFNYITSSSTCLYCTSDIINNNIILETKFNNITGFCSMICSNSICKQIYTTLIPKYKYNNYLIPYELIRNKNHINKIINNLRYELNLYGGYITHDKYNYKIEFFITKQ